MHSSAASGKRSVRIWLWIVTLAVFACSTKDDPASPAHGALEITVAGLASSQAASIDVSGPNNYTQTVSATTTIPDLVPGSYTIDAASVIANGVALAPTPASQHVTVSGGATAEATVTYATTALTLAATQVAQGLTSPVYLTAPANDTRLFVVEQPGRIRIIKNGALLATSFLDITSKVNYSGERGLLSVAFDPAYATNGRFYVYYTGAQGDIFVERYTATPSADVANTTSDLVITIQHRDAANHNGGLLMFGPDGYLYFGTGDGGGGGDPSGNGQNINSMLGKLLRINVAALPYTIPPGNPFVGQAGADEIWAYGLRNPWRYSFDGTGATAKLYIADVGQNSWEEVNAVPAASAGLNYGWRTMEGIHCYNPSSGCNTNGLTLPVLEYSHGDGCSITGGYVYRGSAIPEIRGYYFYSDYCSGFLRSFRLSGTGVAADQLVWPIGNIGSVQSFGVDSAGELYIVSSNGRIYRIVRA